MISPSSLPDTTRSPAIRRRAPRSLRSSVGQLPHLLRRSLTRSSRLRGRRIWRQRRLVLRWEGSSGGEAVQVGYHGVREDMLTRPELGHLGKVSTTPLRHLSSSGWWLSTPLTPARSPRRRLRQIHRKDHKKRYATLKLQITYYMEYKALEERSNCSKFNQFFQQ